MFPFTIINSEIILIFSCAQKVEQMNNVFKPKFTYVGHKAETNVGASCKKYFLAIMPIYIV